jgi:cysteine desulfurase/selenocysteine lyase
MSTIRRSIFWHFSGHKLYGPTGVGVLYGRRRLLESMDPFLCGGNMIRRVPPDSSDFAELPAKFEAGTLPIAEAIALGSGGGLCHRARLRGAGRLRTRADPPRPARQLSQIPDLRIIGPAAEHRGSIVSFTVEGVHPHDMAELLDRRGVGRPRRSHHCTMPLHELLGVQATTRASFAF